MFKGKRGYMRDIGKTIDMIIKREQQLLEPETRGSREELDNLIAEEFVEFSSSGFVCNKADILKDVSNYEPIEVKAACFEGKMISNNVVLVTYNTWKSDIENCALRSSIWKLIDEKWQMIFHQGTLVKKEAY